MDRSEIPDALIGFLVANESQRCPDCGGYTADAARYGFGHGARFCSCPYDQEHK